MGLYDREYYREDRPPSLFGGDRSMVATLIIVNVGVYLAQLLFGEDLTEALMVRPSALTHPTQYWKLLTAGFAHDPHNLFHVIFNMFFLWLFGRDVEQTYGKTEFLRIYLVLVVGASTIWAASRLVQGQPDAPMLGASGAVTGVIALFVWNFPTRTFLFWGVIPMPAWVLGLIFVAQDLRGLMSPDVNVLRTAFEAHLAGFALGSLYYLLGMNIGRLLPGGIRWPRFGRPKLRVHDPSAQSERLEDRVDAVLDKVNRVGIDGLTPDERRILEDASRRYQRRRS